jgi:TonB family protein
MKISTATILKARRIPNVAVGLMLVCLAGMSTARLAKADMLHVTEDQAKRSIVAKVMPVTPPLARQVHLSGRVVVELTVTEDGSVEKADAVSGNPVLAGAALKAGKGWTFTPFKDADGKPSKAVVRISFDFAS